MICTTGEWHDILNDQLAWLEYDLDAEVITGTSRALEDLFGYGALRGDLIGKPVEVLVPDALRDTHAGHRKQYSAAPCARTMSTRPLLEGQHKDGSRFPVVVGLYPGVAGPLSNRHRVVIAIVFDMSAGNGLAPAALDSPAAPAPA